MKKIVSIFLSVVMLATAVVASSSFTASATNDNEATINIYSTTVDNQIVDTQTLTAKVGSTVELTLNVYANDTTVNGVHTDIRFNTTTAPDNVSGVKNDVLTFVSAEKNKNLTGVYESNIRLDDSRVYSLLWQYMGVSHIVPNVDFTQTKGEYVIKLKFTVDNAGTTSIYTIDDSNEVVNGDLEYVTDAKLLLSGEITSTPPDVYYILGNVEMSNNDVDLNDAVLLQKRIAKACTFSDLQNKAGDINANGDIDLEDAVLLQKYLARVNTGYPIGSELLFK